MKTRPLKQILNDFGWDQMQIEGLLPPEIKSRKFDFSPRSIHHWHLYALNGVYVVTLDQQYVTELCGIAKIADGEYERRRDMPNNSVVEVKNLPKFLDGFKPVHDFRHNYLFVRESDMHFDGIGRRAEKTGELYHSPRL